MHAIRRSASALPISRTAIHWLWVIAVSLISVRASYGLTISPTVLEMSASTRSTAQIRLENHNTHSIPIEASLRQLVFDANGGYDTQDADDVGLMIFPPAAVLPAGGIQVFRLQWLGGNTLPASQSFFVRFTQPPLENDLADAPSGVAIEIHYNALVHLSSPSQRAQVFLSIDPNGEATVSNRGNRYTFLSRLQFLHDKHPSIDAPEQVFGERFLPPFSSFTFPAPAPLQTGEYESEAQ
ncbi:hypothetical protein L4D15_06795 [Enterovibrio norvegicus]|uniref:fimbrial biogenesis chaperone n=1 Tax=Enterovibrio norvegicus TaxID=188144 RepID=UPI003D0F626F